jgi:hypothetical protein
MTRRPLPFLTTKNHENAIHPCRRRLDRYRIHGGKQVVTQTEKEEQLSFFSKLVAMTKKEPKAPSMLKQRKAPIKIEPKVFFANERTFLAWMHISIILAGASIAILAFSGSSENPGSQLYGVVMLPVAIAFIIYSMYQCEYHFEDAFGCWVENDDLSSTTHICDCRLTASLFLLLC